MFAKIANRVHDGQRAVRCRSIVADRVIARELVRLTTVTEHEDEPGAAARPAPPLPERGQVVNVRGASWAVTDVISQSPPRGAASASPGTGQDDDDPGVTHIVELQSLEEAHQTGDRFVSQIPAVEEQSGANTPDSEDEFQAADHQGADDIAPVGL